MLTDGTRRCQKPALLGTNICREHGGNAPQVKAAAKARIEKAADRLAQQLLGMAADDELPPAVKLGALKDALDRAGLSPRQAFDVTHELKPYEQTLQRLERGPRPGREAEPEIIDAEIVDESSAAPACAGCGAQFPAELPPHLDAYPEFCRDCRDAGLDSAPASSGAPSDETRESSGPVPESGPRYSGEEARSGPLPGRGYPSPDEARQARTRTARDPGDAPGAGEHGYVTAEEGARLAARDYRRPRPRKRRV